MQSNCCRASNARRRRCGAKPVELDVETSIRAQNFMDNLDCNRIGNLIVCTTSG